MLRALSSLGLGPREGVPRGHASLGGDLADGRAVGERAEHRRAEKPVRRERSLTLFEKRPAFFERDAPVQEGLPNPFVVRVALGLRRGPGRPLEFAVLESLQRPRRVSVPRDGSARTPRD